LHDVAASSRCARASAVDTMFGGQSSDLRKAGAASSLATLWWDLRPLPLAERKAKLARLLAVIGGQQLAYLLSTGRPSRNF
jgi:hypothetical protein